MGDYQHVGDGLTFLFKTIIVAAFLLCFTVPLALWKLYDILCWLIG